jgi:hypothetical protein
MGAASRGALAGARRSSVTDVTPSLRTDLLRLLLVIGVLELAAVRVDLDADAIFTALR